MASTCCVDVLVHLVCAVAERHELWEPAAIEIRFHQPHYVNITLFCFHYLHGKLQCSSPRTMMQHMVVHVSTCTNKNMCTQTSTLLLRFATSDDDHDDDGTGACCSGQSSRRHSAIQQYNTQKRKKHNNTQQHTHIHERTHATHNNTLKNTHTMKYSTIQQNN